MVPLSTVGRGVEVEVQRLEGLDPRRLARLSLYGLVPGCTVSVVQRHPAPVVKIGETEVALERQILEQIFVGEP